MNWNIKTNAWGIYHFVTYLFSLYSPRIPPKLKSTHYREELWNDASSCYFKRCGTLTFWSDQVGNLSSVSKWMFAQFHLPTSEKHHHRGNQPRNVRYVMKLEMYDVAHKQQLWLRQEEITESDSHPRLSDIKFSSEIERHKIFFQSAPPTKALIWIFVQWYGWRKTIHANFGILSLSQRCAREFDTVGQGHDIQNFWPMS